MTMSASGKLAAAIQVAQCVGRQCHRDIKGHQGCCCCSQNSFGASTRVVSLCASLRGMYVANVLLISITLILGSSSSEEP